MEKLDLGLPSYMGRGIITGLTTQGSPANIYFIEGRSGPSRRRKLDPYTGYSETDNLVGRVRVDANSETSIDEMIREGGNPRLLLYDAMSCTRDGLLVVSNGFQTNYDAVWEGEGRETVNLVGTVPGGIEGKYNSLKQRLSNTPRGAAMRSVTGMARGHSLATVLSQTGSEVDPIRTARIGCIREYDLDPETSHIGIVVRPRTPGGGFAQRDMVQDNRIEHYTKGEFVMLATYGVHSPKYYDALPPDISTVNGYRTYIHLGGLTPEELVEEVWEALPKEILVGVAAAMRDPDIQCGFRFAKRNMKE